MAACRFETLNSPLGCPVHLSKLHEWISEYCTETSRNKMLMSLVNAQTHRCLAAAVLMVP